MDATSIAIVAGAIIGSGIFWRRASSRVKRVVLLACGSSYHAGLVGKRVFEEWTRLPAEALIASEFRYASPVIDDKTLAILITQSGETADTIASMRLAKSVGAQTLALTNTIGSSITRGVTATVRRTRGDDIDAACGQLAGQVHDRTTVRLGSKMITVEVEA